MRLINLIIIHSVKCPGECHYLINENGDTFQVGDEQFSLEHTDGLNESSISISLDLSCEKIKLSASLSLLCLRLIKRYNISKMDIISHKVVDQDNGCHCINAYDLLKGF